MFSEYGLANNSVYNPVVLPPTPL